MKKILIADDEARIRRLVCDFLKNAGFETVEAADGNEAIEKFLECGDIDLVICDIMMPGADGWEVCKRIRESADVPILMLTARSQEFDELMSFESGADDFVTKPFSPVVLVKRVQALLKRSEGKKAESGDIISANVGAAYIRLQLLVSAVTVIGEKLGQELLCGAQLLRFFPIAAGEQH